MTTEMQEIIRPIGLFHTPDNWDYIMDWIHGHNEEDRPHLTTAAAMSWNLAAKAVEKAAGADPETPPKKLNGYPVMGAVATSSCPDIWVVMVKRETQGDFVTARWSKHCGTTWVHGHYGLTHAGAIADMADRLGVKQCD